MVELKGFRRSARLSEIRVSYRRRKGQCTAAERIPVLNTAQAAEKYLRSIWTEHTLELVEDFFLVCLTTQLEPFGWVRISRGGFDMATADPRVIFAVALQTASAAILVAHNHPSGNPKPSGPDIAMKKRLKEASALLDVRLLDHIILTREAAYSFAENELL